MAKTGRRAASVAATLFVAACLLVLAASSNAGSSTARSDAGLVAFAVYWPTSLDALQRGTDSSVICGVDLNGRSYRLTTPSASVVSQPAWSPNGDRLAVVSGVNERDIVAFTLGAHGAQTVSDAQSPSWSPDGRLAFQAPEDALTGPSHPPSIWIQNADASGRQRLAAGRGRVTWRPDGSEFALPGTAGLQVMALDGAPKRTLLPGTYVPWADWSPDGARLVVVTASSSSTSISLVNADGSGEARFPASQGYTPVWSPTARWIAYQTSTTVTIVPPGGGASRVLYRGLLESNAGLAWQPKPTQAVVATLPPCVLSATPSHHIVLGSPFDDLIWGTNSADRLASGAGADIIDAKAGNDVVHAGPGADQVDGGAGADDIDGAAGADLLRGGAGNDRITGGSGADQISGGPGEDTIYARDGQRDVVSCGPGRDTVYADKIEAVAKDCERVLRR